MKQTNLDGHTLRPYAVVGASAALHAQSSTASADALYLTEPGDSTAISVNDIHQGQLGDCYLLSSIGELALNDPSAISNMITANANGTETVTLYGSSSGSLPGWNTTAFKTVNVTVTNDFLSSGVNSTPGQDVVNGQQEIWVQVLEKAVATLGGGYGSIANGGNPALAMEAITGQAATPTQPAALSAQTLQSDAAAGDMLVFDTGNTSSDNLVGDHAYMFDGLTTVSGVAEVQRLNPWGTYEPGLIPVSHLASDFVEVDVGHAPKPTPTPVPGPPPPVPTPVTIAGLTSTQAITDEATLRPFAHLSLTGAAAGTTQTATVTFSAATGSLSQLGTGSYNAATGTYTVTGSLAAVTTALDNLLFTPTAHQVAPKSSETTTLSVAVGSSHATTTVIATAVTDPLNVTGAAASLATSDTAALRPYASLAIVEPDAGQTLTASVSLTAAANGALSDTSGGTVTAGAYTVSGSVASVTAALQKLTFTPLAHQVAAGKSVATSFTLKLSDTAGASTTGTTRIVATGTAPSSSSDHISASGQSASAMSFISQLAGKVSVMPVHAMFSAASLQPAAIPAAHLQTIPMGASPLVLHALFNDHGILQKVN